MSNDRKIKNQPPRMFRPLLWSLKWDNIDIEEDKDDIIINTVNEGALRHWHWMIKTYGKKNIRRVLIRHLKSEFHPESMNLAKVIFGIPEFSHARKRGH